MFRNLLKAFVIVVGMSCLAQVAEAKCGAVAMSDNGATGAAWNYDSCSEAESDAYKICSRRSNGKACMHVVSARYEWIVAFHCTTPSGGSSGIVRSGVGLGTAMSRAEAGRTSGDSCRVKSRIHSDGDHE